MPEFDAARYKQTQHDQWNKDGAAWHRWGATLEDWFAEVTATIGRVVVAAYTAPEKNDWGSTPISVIRRRAHLPPPVPGQPGPFSLGAAGVLQGALDQAGFRNVVTRVVSTPLRMPSARDCIRFQRESFGGFNQMMAHLSTQERESIWDEVEDAMKRYEGPDGFIAPCESSVAVGYKP